MVYKSEKVVNRIKAASNTEEVRLLLDKYIDRLKLTQGSTRIDRKYTMNILMALEYDRLKEPSEQTRTNLVAAIEIVKNLHVDAIDTPW